MARSPKGGCALAVRTAVVGVALVVALLAMAGSAWAEPATLCVKATKVTPPKPAKKHYTGQYTNSACTASSATHEGKYEKLASFTASEEAQLKALLKYVQVQASGVGGKPTVQFTGANVQVVNGEGKTNTTNGAGNLVIGYDENPGTQRGAPGLQTGSHDLILGEEQQFTSYGGIDAGVVSTISGPFASVMGGQYNRASESSASVSGGFNNTASNSYASVSGGVNNTAKAQSSAISGGYGNKTEGSYSSVSGGDGNNASGETASVGGGLENAASGHFASVSGGELNKAEGYAASIFGGKGLKAPNNYEAIP